VLDLGAGDGRHSIEASRWPCHVVAVEIDVEVLKIARGWVPRDGDALGLRGPIDFILGDAQHLPFRDGAFDKIMCTEVLEHIPDDKQGIRELHRVARPGGHVAVSVPRYWPERVFWTLSWDYWHSPGGHVRQYRPGQMARYLREQGFIIGAVRYRHAFQAGYWFLRCIFGLKNERRLLPYTVFRFVNWYHRARIARLEQAEALLNLIMGKDMIHYTTKPVTSIDGHAPAIEERAQEARAR
jgi:SAM-dependent methyltransferase